MQALLDVPMSMPWTKPVGSTGSGGSPNSPQMTSSVTPVEVGLHVTEPCCGNQAVEGDRPDASAPADRKNETPD